MDESEALVMLPASRLPAIRTCLLLILSVVLLSASVCALAAGADPSRALASANVHAKASARAATHRARSSRSSSRGSKCDARARSARRHRDVKPCAIKKSKTTPTNPSAPASVLATSLSPPIVSSSAQPSVNAEDPLFEPTEPSQPVPGKEPGTPVAPTPIRETIRPVEPVETQEPEQPVGTTPEKEPEPPAQTTPAKELERLVPPIPEEEPVAPAEPTPIGEPSPIEPAPIVAPGEPREPVAPSEPAQTTPEKQPAPSEETPQTKKLSTTTTLISSTNPSTVGEAVTYTATVNSTAATGTIEIKEAGVTIAGCAVRPINVGAATCTVTDLTAGEHWVTAAYSGASNYRGSTSTGFTQIVNKKTTTTAMTSSLDPSTVGEAVTYTATVNSTAATGTVEFKEAGTTIAGCAAQPMSGPGTATCTVANVTSGTHWIAAVYSGDNNNAKSSFPGLIQTVDKKTTTTAMSSSLNPSTVGQPVTYTASVSPVAATGTVSFDAAGTPIKGCTAQTINAGAATCTVANLAAGWPRITAVYSGDSSYAASSFPGLTQAVNEKTTTTAMTSSLDPSTVGEAVTYTATVNSTVATGTVEFKEAGATIASCAAQPIDSGVATCTVADLAAGEHGVTTVYSGDSNYAASWSPGLTQTVNKKTTTTTVSSSSNPSIVGQSVTYTATVRPASATGTVAFEEEGTPITDCTAQLVVSGTAKCTVTGSSGWSSYTIIAAYSGDSSDLASVSSMFTQMIKPPVNSTALFRFFSPESFWNESLPADAPVDPNSVAMVDAFDEEIMEGEQAGDGPWINTTKYSIPVYTVPEDESAVSVRLVGASSAALSSAWSDVPLPSTAKPAVGTDGNLVVWQPSTDRLWEFHQMVKGADGWQASWGGAIRNVSSNAGVYGPEAWPGAEPWWGASASSLSLVGGLISLEDLESGQINHALEMSIPKRAASVFVSPAQRTDGESTDPLALPEGAHLRLNPSLNLAALHLPRLTLMLAEAAQRYGIFITDGTGTSGIAGFYAQDPSPIGTNPYTGPNGYFEGQSPTQLLASFPWNQLQLLKMELHGKE